VEASFDRYAGLVAVRELRAIRGPARAVLYALVSRANRDGESWASFATLAHDAGIAPSTAKEAIRALERGGYVAVEHGRGERNVYRLTLPDPVRETAAHGRQAATRSDVGRVRQAAIPVRETDEVGRVPTGREPATPVREGDGGCPADGPDVSASRTQSSSESSPMKRESGPAHEDDDDPDLRDRPIACPQDFADEVWEALRTNCYAARAAEPTRELLARYRLHTIRREHPHRTLAAHIAGFEYWCRTESRYERPVGGPRFIRDEPAPAPYHRHYPRGYVQEGELVSPEAAAAALPEFLRVVGDS